MLNQLKAALYERVTAYWGGATVVWGATEKVKPPAPLVVLRLGTVTRATQPITQMIRGIVFSAYPSELTVQVDLFTQGNAVEIDGEEYYENTAAGDLLDFVSFIDSPATVEWSNRHDVSIEPLGSVQDLSEVVNDSQWQYRAMVELRLAFTGWAAEYNGVISEAGILLEDGVPVGIDNADWKQTASGGGTQELANATTGAFEETSPIFEQEELFNG